MIKVKKIEDLISAYISDISSAQNEEVKRQIFVILLGKLFGEMDDAKQIVKEFVFGAEHRISNINRVNKKSDFGRADTQYRSVIVEFEQNLKRTGEQYWLSEDLVVYANEQTNERIEEDPWVEVVQTMLKTRKEISLKEACKVCFKDLQYQHITTMMTRRMSHCLQMAGWRKDGRFNSGPQRNQARFVKEAEDNSGEGFE